MKFRLSLRTRLLLPILTALFFAAIIGSSGVYCVMKQLSDQHLNDLKSAHNLLLKQRITSKYNEYTSLLNSLQKRALEQAAMFSTPSWVISAYKLAATGNTNDEDDPKSRDARKILKDNFKEFQKGYLAHTKLGIPHIHFHIAPARSLARTWRDGWQVSRDDKKFDITDDLSSFRQTVVQAIKNNKNISGIEVGRGGLVIRGVCPITINNNQVIGSVEDYFEYSPLLKLLKNREDENFAIFMDSALLKIASKLNNPEKYPPIGKDYITCASTDQSLINAVITPEYLAKCTNQKVTFEINKYSITLFPVPDFAGKQIGILCMLINTTELNQKIITSSLCSNKNINRCVTALIAGIAFIIIIVCIIVWIAVGRISRRVREISAALRDLARGNTNTEVKYRATGELGDMADACRDMITSNSNIANTLNNLADGDWTVSYTPQSEDDIIGKNLEILINKIGDALASVSKSAEQVNSSSTEIAIASNSVSQSSAESAGSLQNISSSMSALDTQTGKNAEDAGNARIITSRAKEAAETGSNQMHKMVSAMDAIATSSEKINNITKVIDDISFQTNLLALNATVEAARAASHGKGFSVVAEEVRNLASRSAKAAKEISDLIQQSGDNVKNGTALAASSFESLQSIVSEIISSAELIDNIADSSNTQAESVVSVKDDIHRIDGAIQQNTASAEQTAAAAAELKQQSTALISLLHKFNLKE